MVTKIELDIISTFDPRAISRGLSYMFTSARYDMESMPVSPSTGYFLGWNKSFPLDQENILLLVCLNISEMPL